MLTTASPYARRASRRDVELSCDVICSDWDEPFTHSMNDLSAYGVWLRTSFPRQVGETVVLSFRPPKWGGQRELNVFARVARVKLARRGTTGRRTGGMGLVFTDLTGAEKRMLENGLGN
jgi:hypothetical protein